MNKQQLNSQSDDTQNENITKPIEQQSACEKQMQMQNSIISFVKSQGDIVRSSNNANSHQASMIQKMQNNNFGPVPPPPVGILIYSGGSYPNVCGGTTVVHWWCLYNTTTGQVQGGSYEDGDGHIYLNGTYW